MPKILLTPYQTGVDDAPLFVVDHAVGQGGRNCRADVLLVQYLLRVASEQVVHEPGVMPTGESQLKIDGVCGPQTIRFITNFQKEQSRVTNTVPVDGKVDPITTHRFATLRALNNSLRNRRRGSIWTLNGDPLFPREIWTCFFDPV